MEFKITNTMWSYTDGSSGLVVTAQHLAGGGAKWEARLRCGRNDSYVGEGRTREEALEHLIAEAPGKFTEKLRRLALLAEGIH